MDSSFSRLLRFLARAGLVVVALVGLTLMDTPAVAQSCDQQFAHYEGSNWWWGAFGNCKHPGGPTDRTQIFECAWAQVPPSDKSACLKAKLLVSNQTKNGIDNVAAANGAVASNMATESPPVEACREIGPAHVPHGYFLTPNGMTDSPSTAYDDPAGQGLNIGQNEGRLRPELRDAARRADPVSSLAQATYHFALASLESATRVDRAGNEKLGNAFADLSVSGRASYAQFVKAPPTEDQLLAALHDRHLCASLRCEPEKSVCAPGCPVMGKAMDAALRAGSTKALDRAYAVLNVLRVSNMVKAADGTSDSSPERRALGWIAVSGEDDQPHRPVNVPSTRYSQFDMTVTAQGRQVKTRYMIAQTQGALAPTTPLAGRQLPSPQVPTLAPNAEVLLFIHGMDSRLEEADDLVEALRTVAPTKNYAVISLDLPSSGYADNIDHCAIPRAITDPRVCSSLFELGDPKEPPQWFDAHNRHNVPVLEFVEAFIVAFVDALDQRVPIKARFRTALGGSLGGNMSLRLGRRMDLPWLHNVVAWSPGSIWESLADGTLIMPHTIVDASAKHGGVRAGWMNAGGNANELTETAGARRQFFSDAFDKSILGGLVNPPQAQMWFSDRWPCKQSALVGARLDRHETYNRNFRLWHWRLGTEQLIFSHASNDAAGRWLFLSNTTRTLLMCGRDDDFAYTNICSSTQWVASRMTNTPGQALFLNNTGHSIDNEHPTYFARKVSAFLSP